MTSRCVEIHIDGWIIRHFRLCGAYHIRALNIAVDESHYHLVILIMFACRRLSIAFSCEWHPGRCVFHIRIVLPGEHHPHSVFKRGIRGVFDLSHLRA